MWAMLTCAVGLLQGIREAARLVDIPCNELHTTAFLDEVCPHVPCLPCSSTQHQLGLAPLLSPCR